MAKNRQFANSQNTPHSASVNGAVHANVPDAHCFYNHVIPSGFCGQNHQTVKSRTHQDPAKVNAASSRECATPSGTVADMTFYNHVPFGICRQDRQTVKSEDAISTSVSGLGPTFIRTQNGCQYYRIKAVINNQTPKG
jgi:hypothetical protein